MADGPDVVCVTGMHRSGTSLTARLLALLGIELGDEGRFVPARRDNPRGFWEHDEVRRINEDLLLELGGSWADPPGRLTGWEREAWVTPFRRRAARVVERLTASGSDMIGWKDPRCALLLPFWQTVTPITTTFVVVRHPAEVAASLSARDGIAPEHAAFLWLRYTASAWAGSSRPHVVLFERLFGDLEATMQHMAAVLGRPAATAEELAAAQTFLDRDLRHHREEETAVVPGPYAMLAAKIHELVAVDAGAAIDVLMEALAADWPRSPEWSDAASEVVNEDLRERRSVRLALRAADGLQRVRRILTPGR